jgi:hypothetical protein
MSVNVVYLEAHGRLHQPADRRGGGSRRKRSSAIFPELLAQRDIDAAGRRRRLPSGTPLQKGYRALAGLARRHALLFQVIATVAAVLALVLTFY